MSTLAVTQTTAMTAESLEKVLVHGDLSALTASQHLDYLHAVCASVGLNPLTRPLEYLTLEDRLVLYARKDATDQLRKIHNITTKILSRLTESDGSTYSVIA